jgi:hypothetical protein
LLARFVLAKSRKSFLLAQFCVRENKERLPSACEMVLAYFLRIVCSSNFQRFALEDVISEQRDVTFEVTDASFVLPRVRPMNRCNDG